MARSWSKRSKEQYDTLDPRLQRVVERLRDEVADITLLKGFRGEVEQNAAFDAGRSKVRWPNGNHNHWPSKAVDLQPYPMPEEPLVLWAALGYLAGAAVMIGREEGVTIRWGGDWDRDGDLTDTNFYDLFHIEIRDD